MNFIYNRRLDFHFILNDKVDKDKLIKSINVLNKKNKIIKLAKANITQSCTNKKIYIIIEDNNFIVNFSHLFYDAYSINLVLQKIDEIYKMGGICKGEIKKYMEELDQDLVSINTDNLRIMNRVYGSKYKLDTDLIEHIDKKFYTVKPTYYLNSKEVDDYIKKTDIIPNGISINPREKQVSVSLKKKPEQGEIE